MSAVRLRARDLTVRFDERTVLDGVDFDLDAGALAVIEGPSGGGKSTFLRALATLEPLSRGEILLDGELERGLSPSSYRVRVAYVPQLPVMFPGTVADNLRAGPRLRGVELSDEAVGALLEKVALDRSFAPRTARDLSGGEKQRVAIGRALANEPRVLLFDEPTSALDPASSGEILELVRACVEGGAGVVVVTHARDQALALGGARYVCEGARLSRIEGS